MTVGKLQRYLDRLLAEDRKFDPEVVAAFKSKARDRLGGFENNWKFIAEKVLGEHADRFATKAARLDLGRFLMEQVKSKRAPWEPFLELCKSIPALANLLIEAHLGQFWEICRDGGAPPEVIHKVRQEAQPINFRGTASLAKIQPQCLEVATIEAAMGKAIQAINGFDFLSQPPSGKVSNQHTILIKPGVNWGQFGYPTVSSWESVYALTKMCFQEARNRQATVEVIVADESGIEIVLWGGTTMENLEHTGVLHAAVLAGLEQAVFLEEAEPGKYSGARDLLVLARAGPRVSFSPKDDNSVRMIEMARRAGVRVEAFDQLDRQQVSIPGARHFTAGIPLPRIVMEEVTDILNLPKPPGRHLIMGNSGLSGALKNHIGLLARQQRSPNLHGRHDRYPPPAPGETKESYLENIKVWRQEFLEKKGDAVRKFALQVMINWESAPSLPFHEKIVELYAAVADKERFSVSDMRRTCSSIGPDLGNTIDIGAVIAAKDPVTLDIIAGALLKLAYEKIGAALDALAPGGDNLLEYLVGKTWLKCATAFDLMSHIAANSYGFGPVDADHIDFKGVEDSGFSNEEMAALTSILQGKQ